MRTKIITFGLPNDKYASAMTKEKEEAGKKSSKAAKGPVKSKSFLTDERIKFIFGILITGFAFYLLLACISYLFSWKADQSLPLKDVVSGPEVVVKNWSGKSGYFLADLIIRNGFGFGAFFIPLIFGAVGLYMLRFPKIKPVRLVVKFSFAAIILSLLLGYIGFLFGNTRIFLGSGPGGAHGYKIAEWLNAFMGKPGTGILLLFLTISYLVLALRVRPESFGWKLPSFFSAFRKKQAPDGEAVEEEASGAGPDKDVEAEPAGHDERPVSFFVRNTNVGADDEESDNTIPEVIPRGSIIRDFDRDVHNAADQEEEVPLNINRPGTEGLLSEHEVERIMENYDPRLDLSRL